MPHEPTSVSRAIAASPDTVFAIVADPARHHEIDGSGTVRGSVDTPERMQVGSTFSMNMNQGLPYKMVNEVTEFEPDRRIAWRPWFVVAGRRIIGGVTWRYEITPTDDGCTVTETYDVTTGTPSKALARAGFPEKQARAMAATLDRLAALAEGTTPR
jgi:hypothetical protein